MIISAIIALSCVSSVTGLSHSNLSRYSFVSTRDDYVLLGHEIANHLIQSLLSCAQLCLAHTSCLSFNFKMSSGRGALCGLNDKAALETSTHGLQKRKGCVFGEWTSVWLQQFTFTTLGNVGRTGPKNTSGYQETSLEGQVQLVNGIQLWTVPFSGTYMIEACGASGANGTCTLSGCLGWRRGGLGARVKGTFYLAKETQVSILVGQAGLPILSFPGRPGGGGGGTFVVLGKETPIIIAGGGGGGGISKPHHIDGDPGQTSGRGTQHGGSNGSGGSRYDPVTNQTSSDIVAGSGAGFSGDGDASVAWTAAKSFLNGGTGGEGALGNGGFGGGGFSMTQGGGGGGYSGGGVTGNAASGAAGGGGSYNVGWFQENVIGVNKGDGLVVIIQIS